jgi:nitrous oxidase accessory protein
VLLAALLSAGSSEAGAEIARPDPCFDVSAGAALQAQLDAAPAGAALCLEPGEYLGPLLLDRGITLWGPRTARVVSRGRDSTIVLRGEGPALLGVTVDGSGGRFDRLDAAVLIEARGARVEGVRVMNALFGILVQRAARVRIAGNVVEGAPGKALGLRGDAIRLWETRDSVVVDNHVQDARDVVAWYAPGNRFAGNRIDGGRYGLHFMYSHGCHVEDNDFSGDVVGVFVMYSRGLRIAGNRIAHSSGAAGIGIGLKESGDLEIRGNELVDNTVGLYLDESPLDPAQHNRIEGNALAFNDRAIVFHGRAERNHFAGNSLRENAIQVALEGAGDARGAAWRGNHFDDYLGYDLDRDGVGDLPYQLASVSASWTAHAPAIAFFRGTPALALAEWLGRAVPLFRPTTLLVDETPRMEGARAR